MKGSTKRLCAVSLAAVLGFSTIPVSVQAATMDVLLNGHDLRLEYVNGGVVLVTFNADGTYTTNTGSSGSWTLEEEDLCTVRNSDNASACGHLPIDKSPGDVWTSTDADGVEVIASIVPRQ